MGLISKGSSIHISGNSRAILDWLARAAVTIIFYILIRNFDQLCAVFPFLWVLHFLGWAGIIISIIMLWRFGCPHLYWAKIFLTVCKFYLNNKMINSIKAALGFPLAIFLQTSVWELNHCWPSKRAQSMQQSLVMSIRKAQRKKT